MACVTAILLSGCGAASNEADALSPEQKQALFQALMQKMQQPSSSPVQKSASLHHAVENATKTLDEKELLAKIGEYPSAATGIRLERKSDGFLLNGEKMYVDFEGPIVRLGYDWRSGDAFYIVKLSNDTYRIKYQKMLSGRDPLTVGLIRRDGLSMRVETVTGKRFNGRNIIPTSKGFVVTREKTAFVYEVGKRPVTFIAPEGWHIAAFQNGDVATTGFILLERDGESETGNPFSDLMKSTVELGNALGVTTKSDYMLVNMKNPTQRKMINVTLGEKEVALFSQCRKQNRYVRICDTMEIKKSLYQPNGLKNFNHYYWNIHWFKGKKNIFSITKESNNRVVLVSDLEHNRSVEVASRVTGFPEYVAKQSRDGVVKVHVEGGLLPSVDIDDAEAVLDESI
ncbi:hypothetical protein [Hydrogenimonas cancrithermarum]|nr:hypothetical protein [Hydrogenimonas cancrithermarum]